ncbi:hypothetical protein SDC9_07790 [bioreactor metagenome]|uniref:Uncharacterized protein n=1 Tax=bioreactor metagenome TaxID=1076179 RepID=A0A644T5H0_9ZZZZ
MFKKINAIRRALIDSRKCKDWQIARERFKQAPKKSLEELVWHNKFVNLCRF